MAQIGDQRHSRPGLRRHISINDISPPRNNQGFVKSRTNVIVVAFVVLIVVLFVVITFGRTASKAASPSAAVDYHPGDNGEDFAVGMPEPLLRGSEKEDTIRANMGGSSSGPGESEIIKARLNVRKGIQEVDIDSIAKRGDATSKAAYLAVKAEREAVDAVKEDDDSFFGEDPLEELWDVFLVRGKNT